MKKYAFLLSTLLFTACNSGEEITTRRVMEPATVVEYTPAPGQFIGDPGNGAGFDGESTSEAAVAYADKRLSKNDFVSLGGWGGYIVAKFDRAVPAGVDYELYVTGNAMNNSSEPGIVWVLQDLDGDGLANDTWYELRGSEYDTSDRGYEVTYTASDGDISWTDNRGGSGTIDRNTHHLQASYFPAWLGNAPKTYTGTRLPDNITTGTAEGEEAYIPTAFAWGYADNYSSADGTGTVNSPNKFRISNAVTADGQPANLTQIDFIKVQTGINAKAPNIGEVSTEVCGIGCYRIKTVTE